MVYCESVGARAVATRRRRVAERSGGSTKAVQSFQEDERETMLAHRAREGAARVEIANKGRSTKIMEVDDQVPLRDPSRRRAKAGHGLGKPTPAGPLKIVAARGNLIDLQHMESGVTHEAVHAENVVLLQKQVHDYDHPKREALHIAPDPTTSSLSDSRRSPGRLIEAEPFNDGGVEESKGATFEGETERFRCWPVHLV